MTAEEQKSSACFAGVAQRNQTEQYAAVQRNLFSDDALGEIIYSATSS
jgi:hypothetical protein